MTVIASICQAVFGSAPRTTAEVGGGCINHATRVQLADGAVYFIKWNHDAARARFDDEARSLALLAPHIRTPRVIHVSPARDDLPAFLVLEWIESARHSRDFGAKFGAALAHLHHASAESYGLPDASAPDWVTYYREFRLLPKLHQARQLGRLNPARAARFDALLLKLDALIGPVPRTPALLHGDLWGGNYMVTAGDTPVLIDAQSYYGDREAEIAMTELFGGFPDGFHAAYHAAAPLAADYAARRALYQLYHLLEHLNLFGESYGAGVDRILRHYVG